MMRKPRVIGYALMAVTLGIALGGKQGWFAGIGPVPAVAVAIILGAVAVMLVVTDGVVRAMIGKGKALAEAEQRAADEAPRGE